MSDEQIPGYPVDLVLCIDGTGSMTPIIEEVKARANVFHDELSKEMEAKGKTIDSLRVRVVVFRDIGFDGEESFEISDFMSLPEESSNFSSFVSTVTAHGGGDEPESGLEAVALAIQSGWSTSGTKRRQVIVVWTDASAHPLSGTTSLPGVATNGSVPANFDQMTDLWQGQDSPMDLNAQRLILYAPDAFPWTEISNYWENTIHHPSRAGVGLSDVDFQTILDVIAQSV